MVVTDEAGDSVSEGFDGVDLVDCSGDAFVGSDGRASAGENAAWADTVETGRNTSVTMLAWPPGK